MIPYGDLSYKHGYEAESNPQHEYLKQSALMTVPSEHPVGVLK